MRIWRHSLAIPLILALSVVATGAEVRDKAGLFSPEAVKKANADLERTQQATGIPVTIETTPSLNGDTIDMAIPKYAKRDGVRGLFVLIARDEGKIQAESSREYRQYFSRPGLQSIYEAFLPGLMKKDFDSALAAGVANIDIKVNAAKAEAGNRVAPAGPVGRRPMNVPPMGAKSGVSTLIGIVLLVLAVIVGFKIIGALMGAGRGQYGGPGYGGPGYGGGGGGMRGPGYGGPGYGGGGGGGGGGGFMSGLMGGVGGAIAGNWIYDQMTGRRHQVDQSGNVVPGSVGFGPPPDQGADWSGPGDGGGNFGGGGGDGGGGGGGDWGGGGGSGGGGDWGGGGGGGDWGGGGGGGGDGGSW